MSSKTPSDVVALLRGPTLRVRTGLWLVPPACVGHEVQEAARLGLDANDARRPILDGVKEGQRFLGLDAQRVLAVIDSLSHEAQLTDCSLVYNLDLLLARLTLADRNHLWDLVFSALPYRPRALFIAMPAGATSLLPKEHQLGAWRQEGRLAESM